jgi:hypothetical protein
MKVDLFIILTFLATGALVVSRYKMFHFKNISVNSGFLFEDDSPVEVICSWVNFLAIVLGFVVSWWAPLPLLIVSLLFSELFLKLLKTSAPRVSGIVVIICSLFLLIQLWRIFFGPPGQSENLVVYLIHSFN